MTNITFQYGGLYIRTWSQLPSGALSTNPQSYGWNRVINAMDNSPTTVIK